MSDGGPAPDDGGKAGRDTPGAPGGLHEEMARLRRRARADRHAYWFPLVLFGLLICGAAAVSLSVPPHPGVRTVPVNSPLFLGGLPVTGHAFYLGWYWAAAVPGGCLLTLAWYRGHARRAGVATSAVMFVLIGVALVLLLSVIPPLSTRLAFLRHVWLPGDLWVRGTAAFLIIAVALWVLSWAERSIALAVITLVYTGAALLASLYNPENLLFRLGWNPGASALGWRLTVLPGALIPAAVLLAGGLATLLTRRRRQA